ncbi:uncharacterized protein LOC122301760 [Carya illinoinensis]|uniref:uncharacterized protein LOC122301760 n=1 Tax=Carya illinoinensis TaxID=32201 RepID=UPI001C71B1F9|nr:uncharacterized protein LOC122301760 [Carya illinoinensis]
MDNRNFVVSVVYAKCNLVERRELWRVLQLDAVQDEPWLCLGDFNTIRGEEEHCGGRPRLRAAIDEFNEFIDNYGFIEMKTVGSKFSWCNGQRGLARSWLKLDRCLMNVVAADVFPNACCKYMARSTSDHTPLSFVFKNLGTRYGPSSFKFQQMWLETQLQVGFSEDVERDLLVAKEDLEMWLQREETRLSQHVKLRWMEKGAVDYFNLFLQARARRELPDLSYLLPSIQEVKVAMFSIPVDSSPGPDGFGSGFYRACWDIVEDDVVAVVRDFFIGNSMPRFYSASYIALIPKMQKPTGFDKFRPISLCSVMYKVFSKILVRRLSPNLNKIISPEQGAFLPGRSIFENISLAQEMIHMLNKKVRGGNTFIKIDMAKAYNSIDWDFLIHVMASFGFSERFCSLIRTCISTPWFSVVMNGLAKGFFSSGRGLCQGDPLLPYLFILVEEVLSRLLKHKFTNGNIVPFSHPRGTPLVSHLLYADDIVLFVNGRRSSLQEVRDICATYEEWSGQMVSKEKSCIFFSKHAAVGRKRSSLMLTSFSEGFFPVKYLGVPLMAVMTALNRIMSNFFWGSWNGKQKRKWVAWEKICSPIREGGLGLRKLKEVQDSLFMKLAWNLLTGDSLWANFFKQKYVKNQHVTLVDQQKGTLFWKHIVGMVPKVLGNSWWRVRNGDVSFWRDPWLKSGALFNSCEIIEYPLLRVRECRLQHGWDVDLLYHLVGEVKMEEILNCLGEQKEGGDLLIWKPNLNGVFSSKSAWDCVRVRAPKSEWASWIWHSALLKRYSVTIWKAFNSSLSVDSRISSLGIPLVSKCECCTQGCVEDQDHVLATGKIAGAIWRYASLQLGIPYDPQRSWRATVEVWFRRATHSTQKGTLIALIPIIVTWSLWVWRSKARMEGKRVAVSSLWSSIKAAVAWVGVRLRASRKMNDGDEKVLNFFSIPLKPVKRKEIHFVRWVKPAVGWFKLNVDGSSLGNPGRMGAGGTIRDEKGNLTWAFAKDLGHGSNNEAELIALFYGLQYCKDLFIRRVEIELDSLLVVHWLEKGRCGIWYLEDYWEKIQSILATLEFKVKHTYREGNA